MSKFLMSALLCCGGMALAACPLHAQQDDEISAEFVRSLGPNDYKLIKLTSPSRLLYDDLSPDHLIRGNLTVGTVLIVKDQPNPGFVEIKKTKNLEYLLLSRGVSDNELRDYDEKYDSWYVYDHSVHGESEANFRSYYVIRNLLDENSISAEKRGSNSLSVRIDLKDAVPTLISQSFAADSRKLTQKDMYVALEGDKGSLVDSSFVVEDKTLSCAFDLGNYKKYIESEVQEFHILFGGKRVLWLSHHEPIPLKNPFLKNPLMRFGEVILPSWPTVYEILGTIAFAFLVFLLYIRKKQLRAKASVLDDLYWNVITRKKPGEDSVKRPPEKRKIGVMDAKKVLMKAIEDEPSILRTLYKAIKAETLSEKLRRLEGILNPRFEKPAKEVYARIEGLFRIEYLSRALTAKTPMDARHHLLLTGEGTQETREIAKRIEDLLAMEKRLGELEREGENLQKTLLRIGSLTTDFSGEAPETRPRETLEDFIWSANTKIENFHNDIAKIIDHFDPSKADTIHSYQLEEPYMKELFKKLSSSKRNELPEKELKYFTTKLGALIEFCSETLNFLNINYEFFKKEDFWWNENLLNKIHEQLSSDGSTLMIPSFRVDEKIAALRSLQSGLDKSLGSLFTLNMEELKTLLLSSIKEENEGSEKKRTDEAWYDHNLLSLYIFSNIHEFLDTALIRVQRIDLEWSVKAHIARNIGMSTVDGQFYNKLIKFLGDFGIRLWKPRGSKLDSIKLFDPQFTFDVTSKEGQAQCKLVNMDDDELKKGEYPVHIRRFDYSLYDRAGALVRSKLKRDFGGEETGYEVIILKNGY